MVNAEITNELVSKPVEVTMVDGSKRVSKVVFVVREITETELTATVFGTQTFIPRAEIISVRELDDAEYATLGGPAGIWFYRA